MRSDKQIEAALFDANGTLFYDQQTLYTCNVALFAHHGVRPPSFEYYWATSQPPLEKWYAENGIHAPIEELDVFFLAEYRKRVHEVKLAPGVRATLHVLKSRGIPMAVVSGFPSDLLEMMLTGLEIRDYFREVVGDTMQKQAALSRIMSEFGVLPANTIFVGDRPSDIRDGLAVGLKPIGFTAGYGTEGFLRVREDVTIIHSFPEILKLGIRKGVDA